MIPVFLDTSFILALELADEQYHTVALNCWKGLIPDKPQLVTTSFIFDETVTFFNSRGRHDKAVEVGSRLLESAAVQLIQVEEMLFLQRWKYFQAHSDKSYSLTDCISFVIMKSLNIQTALTFDHHFSQAGFVKLPVE